MQNPKITVQGFYRDSKFLFCNPIPEICKDFLSDRIGLFVPFDDSECLSADGYESICSRIGELQSIFNLKNIIRMSDIFPRVEFDLQRKLNDGSVGCVSTGVYSLLMEYVGDSFPAYQALVAEQTEVFNSLFSCQYLPLHSIPNKVANQIGAAKVDGIGWCVDLFEEGTLEPFITYLAKSPSIAEIVKQHEDDEILYRTFVYVISAVWGWRFLIDELKISSDMPEYEIREEKINDNQYKYFITCINKQFI